MREGKHPSPPWGESNEIGCDGSMALESAQCADHVLDFILLKQADARDPRRSSFHARSCILYRDATESKNGNLRLTRFSQRGKASGRRSWRGYFFEYRSENGKIDTL